MLSARTGTVKALPSPLTSTDRFTKVSNLRMGARGGEDAMGKVGKGVIALARTP